MDAIVNKRPRLTPRSLGRSIPWLADRRRAPTPINNPAAAPSMNSDQQLRPEAPVGHRQPRADQVPSEKNLMNPNDPVNQENAALDRMINGICRGC